VPHLESAQLVISNVDPGQILNKQGTVLTVADEVLNAEYDGHVIEPTTLTVKVPEHWESLKHP
jgi:hypothetical protein